MIYFLHIGYDGTNYRGWQYQKNVKSIQETIEVNLKKILKKEVVVFGCGRTDAGVHASQYVLHIDIESVDFDLKVRLNHNLPKDIVVYDVLKMEEGQHARFDANSRTYDYFIHLYDDPFLNRVSSQYNLDYLGGSLNYEVMQEAAELISQTRDFIGFCKQPDLYDNTDCVITEAKLYVNEQEQRLRFSITANRFLRGMIRLIVAYLLKVGSGEMTLSEFKLLIENKLDVADKSSAFPNGLYLSKVVYPYLKLNTKKDICSLLKVGLGD